MELMKKLNIFYSSAIEVANKQSNDEMREFKASMELLQEEFKENKKKEMETRCQIEEKMMLRDRNRRVSETVIEQKRKLNLRQQEKKEALFQAVEKKLWDYLKTGEYEEYLVSKICMAKEFARQEEIIIYLNSADGEKKERLEQRTGCALTISNVDFGGGIRAVIRSQNVLIDESFQTKLNQERDAYTF